MISVCGGVLIIVMYIRLRELYEICDLDFIIMIPAWFNIMKMVKFQDTHNIQKYYTVSVIFSTMWCVYNTVDTHTIQLIS